ncbi:glycosyltransferase family 4 protein [Parasedimentitalea psychrophila]|uniref:Glycosyltransferase family 4 protein n=1 Tax=Parasedimentitalea psychrophila TaxID=2997337 RepID=A0A9Y2KW98_9RHOB|nr:glycosyltransferase family 4 protein [Parasedimentitalea psychrophila]WIY24326.1 glycosyltransferase family 4 protein [Parasedimentitalea psychrophila]
MIPRDGLRDCKNEVRLSVAQVIGNLNWGGTQELLVYLAQRQQQEGLRLQVFVLSAPSETPYADRLIAENAPVTYLPRGRGGLVSQIRCLARELTQSGVQLVHAHLRMANTVAPPAGALVGLPVLGGLHLPSPGLAWRARLRGLAESWSLRLASGGAVACAASVGSDNRRRLGDLPIAVVPNPAPEALDIARVEALRAASRASVDPVRFLVVGRLSPEKGLDVILKAARRLAERDMSFRLSIVGDGTEKGFLQDLACELRLEDTVVFHGASPDVPRLLATHDIYLSASRVEGMSISLLEAMAHAMPAIVTPAGGAFALIDETVGRRVPPEDPEAIARAMEELAMDGALRRALGRAAYDRVSNSHRVEDWSGALCDLYRQMLTGTSLAGAGRYFNDKYQP